MKKPKKQVRVDGPIKISGGGVSMTNCEFHLHGPVVDANALAAIKALADAASANAKAIDTIAQRMFGPTADNRTAVRVEGSAAQNASAGDKHA